MNVSSEKSTSLWMRTKVLDDAPALNRGEKSGWTLQLDRKTVRRRFDQRFTARRMAHDYTGCTGL